MSKAEELAKVYLKEKGYLLVSNNGEHMAEIEAINLYIAGYHQAEKDLELTWKDVKTIYRLVNIVADDLGIKAINTNIYEEVLKRFKEKRT